MSLKLPTDLITFLEQKKELEYNEEDVIPKKLKLCKLEELEITTIYVDATEYDDLKVISQGYYEIKAVNLISDCENYTEFCLLMWLPELEMFGSWDQDHWRITIFPNSSWSDICNEPVPYINSQWDDDYCGVGENLDPSNEYTLKEGNEYTLKEGNEYTLKEGMPNQSSI